MTSKITIKEIISIIKTELNEYYPSTEIESFIFLIFEHLLNYSRTKLLVSYHQEISDDTIKKIKSIIQELKLNKPIQYILGYTTFYNLDFKLNENILIPRPETEELVDWIILENNTKQLNILDIGTGSGCIAISLAKNIEKSIVYASDISPDALYITEINKKLNNVHIETLQFDILSSNFKVNQKFDIIVSNPPYITEKEKTLMLKNVLDYEPDLALFVPDNNPLLYYKAIVEFGVNHLNPGGKIYFEINEQFGKEMKQLLEQLSFYDIILKKDINGKNRMIRGIYN